MFKRFVNSSFKGCTSIPNILGQDFVIFNKNILNKYNHSIANRIINKNVQYISRTHLSTTCTQMAKVFQETENLHAYSILQTIPISEDIKPDIKIDRDHVNSENFEDILEENYRMESATKIVNTFQELLPYSISNGIALDDIRFNNLVDGLMDKCQDLTDVELSNLLFIVSKYPPVDSFNSHNFHDIWSALDDVCLWRIKSWSTKRQFQYAEHWFNLRLARVSEYIDEFLKQLSRHTKRLTPVEIVHAFFYMNVSRKHAIFFEFEYELSKHINKLTVDQMAVVSMGYFKTKSHIKIPQILEQMLQKVIEESETIHEISLAAILKIIRYTPNLKHVQMLNKLLDKLVKEVDRFSILCCTHIALLGTNTHIFHPEILGKICNKFLENIEEVRLKDLERMLYVTTNYNFDPKTEPCFYNAILQQLSDPKREDELKKFPRCLACSLHYLTLQGIYSNSLISKVLSSQFILNTYGKSSKYVGREIFSLDTSIQIEQPDYVGNRLISDKRRKVAKWLTEYFPTKNQQKKKTAVENLMLHIQDDITDIVGGEEFIFVHHVLPHFPRADIIVCKNKSGNFVKPLGFENYILGDIMYPRDSENLIWYAFVIASWNNTIRLTSMPLGSIVMKMRQLEKVGFKPILMPYMDLVAMNPNARKKHIFKKLS